MSNTDQTVGRPMEILLVEDSLVDARLTIAALQNGDFQHRLTLVRDGEEAMQFLHQEGKFARVPRPDVILLDLLLPKMDGFQVLREIRDNYDLKSLPVIVMTASEDTHDKSQCELMEIENYITKPINLTDFLTVVKQFKRHLLSDVILPAGD